MLLCLGSIPYLHKRERRSAPCVLFLPSQAKPLFPQRAAGVLGFFFLDSSEIHLSYLNGFSFCDIRCSHPSCLIMWTDNYVVGED